MLPSIALVFGAQSVSVFTLQFFSRAHDRGTAGQPVPVDEQEIEMSNAAMKTPVPDRHVYEVEAKVTALSNALATLGRGTTLAELLKLIHFPGYTTPAEFAITMAMLESMSAQVESLTRMQNELVAATKLIVQAK